MMIAPLGSEVIAVLRAPVVVDARTGADKQDWANATSTTVEGCMVTPFKMSEKLSFEYLQERSYVRHGLKVFAPPGVDVRRDDRVEYYGEVYRVSGNPGVWHDFEGVEDHVEFIMQLKEG